MCVCLCMHVHAYFLYIQYCQCIYIYIYTLKLINGNPRCSHVNVPPYVSNTYPRRFNANVVHLVSLCLSGILLSGSTLEQLGWNHRARFAEAPNCFSSLFQIGARISNAYIHIYIYTYTYTHMPCECPFI